MKFNFFSILIASGGLTAALSLGRSELQTRQTISGTCQFAPGGSCGGVGICKSILSDQCVIRSESLQFIVLQLIKDSVRHRPHAKGQDICVFREMDVLHVPD
ncbi:hypothetical protein V8C42DRAFT_337425 [Trichoderma barbatum]